MHEVVIYGKNEVRVFTDIARVMVDGKSVCPVPEPEPPPEPEPTYKVGDWFRIGYYRTSVQLCQIPTGLILICSSGNHWCWKLLKPPAQYTRLTLQVLRDQWGSTLEPVTRPTS